MDSFVVYLLCGFLFLVLTVETARPRILNGEDAQPHEFPWMAMITDPEGVQVCGGTLINERYVLLAAHCVIGDPVLVRDRVRVRLGAHNKKKIEGNVQVRRVVTVKIHPSYIPMYRHDFALLELESNVTPNQMVNPICLSTPRMDFSEKTAIISGWGFLSRDGPDSSVLQKANVQVMSRKACKEIYDEIGSWKTEITEAMLCAWNLKTGADACKRDSGGPMIAPDEDGRWLLIGVVSWGMGCSTRYPGVYAEVSSAREWITTAIGNTTVC